MLANVQIILKNNKFSVTAFNGEIEISTWCIINATDFQIATIGKKLIDIVASINNNQTIKLSLNNKYLLVITDSTKFQLASTQEKLAQLDNLENDKFATIHFNCFDWHKALNKTIFAMANNDLRPYLNGLLIEIKQNKVIFTATDGHRLVIYKIKTNTNIEQRFLLSKRVAVQLAKFLKKSNEELSCKIINNCILFKMTDKQFAAKLLNIECPDYSQALPQKYQNTLQLPIQNLIIALKRASIISNTIHNGATLEFNKQKLMIIAYNAEQEEIRENIMLNASNNLIFSVALNIGYLLDFLNKIIEYQFVIMSFNDNNSGILFKISQNNDDHYNNDCYDDYYYLLMPMKL